MTTIPAWPFKPNWANNVTETLSWKTSMQRSRIGAEQRQALRVTPRRMIEYPVQLYAEDRAYFDVFIMNNAAKPWMVPIPHEMVDLEVLNAGDTFLPMDTAGREFAIGSKVVLQSLALIAEVVEVTSVETTGLGVTPLTKSYRFARAAPAIVGMITEAVQMTRKSGGVYEGTVRFTALQANPWPVDSRSLVTLPNYLGYPVLTTQPNAANDLDYGYDISLSTIDNEMGIPSYVDQTKRVWPSQKYEFFLVGRQERSDFRDLMYALQGMNKAIWVPTFNDDLAYGHGWPDPDGILGVVPGREFAIQFLRDGTTNIIAADSGGNFTPTLYDSNPIMTSFMSLKRLGVDDIEFVHFGTHDGLTTVSVLFNDAPNLRIPSGYYQPTPNVSADPTDAITQPMLDIVSPVLVSGRAGGQ